MLTFLQGVILDPHLKNVPTGLFSPSRDAGGKKNPQKPKGPKVLLHFTKLEKQTSGQACGEDSYCLVQRGPITSISLQSTGKVVLTMWTFGVEVDLCL